MAALVLAWLGILPAIFAAGPAARPLALTNAAQLHGDSLPARGAVLPVHLTGQVSWLDANAGQLILNDETGGGLFDLPSAALQGIEPGNQVEIRGDGQFIREGELGPAEIRNDGLHAAIEKSGTFVLAAGPCPFAVEWFNEAGPSALNLDWQGPGFNREPVPDNILFRRAAGDGSRRLPGLDYHDYEGKWETLPDFNRLAAVKTGATTNLNRDLASRETDVGLVFSGLIDIPRGGTYTFWLTSDDGSRLCLGLPLQVSRLTVPAPSIPHPITARPLAGKNPELSLTETEGEVSDVRQAGPGATMELVNGASHVFLRVPAGNEKELRKLVHCRIKVRGIYQTLLAASGQSVPSLLVADPADMAVEEVPAAQWADFPFVSLAALGRETFSSPRLLRTSGILSSNAAGFTLSAGNASVTVDNIPQSLPPATTAEILGWMPGSGQPPRLRGCLVREAAGSAPTNALPLLTTTEQIKTLTREQAARGYPVNIQGVVTACVDDNFVIQDGSSSMFCYGDRLVQTRTPRIGEAWRLTGVTEVQFAPDVIAERATYLGPGLMPDPVRPTRGELLNGSLDTRYIEIPGIVIAVETNVVRLLTREGEMQFSGVETLALEHLKNALVRLSGVCIPDRDTNEMLTAGFSIIRLFNSSVSLESPAPADPFALPEKRIADLLLFDARADQLRWIKISGQIIHAGSGECFLNDGTHNARVELQTPASLQAGDLVEVVGFPDVGGASPLLHEALVKVTGRTNLPPPLALTENDIPNRRLDATRVSLESRLIDVNQNYAETVLELKSGPRTYLARWRNKDPRFPVLAAGSWLKLTGIYEARTDRTNLRAGDSFDLLLSSPRDIQVLETPSWWTARHALIVVTCLLITIAGAVVWITQLRRQVEERTRQLAAEIKGREQAESQRALEKERRRIAQDLHDELGATLTEIRFLGAVRSQEAPDVDSLCSGLREVSEKSHQMVTSLDEIVWAINPANDSLPNLANYLCHVAQEFFRAAQIRCRLDVDEELPNLPLTSEWRHNLYLVVREALNNAAKHSQASEVWLGIHYREGSLRITVKDNGLGLPAAAAARNRNGLSNMRSRLEKMGGQFECTSRPGEGTICQILLPAA